MAEVHRIARLSERTTQGGPPNGGRKYGTGGDLVFLEMISVLWWMKIGRILGDGRMARLLDEAGESRGRM